MFLRGISIVKLILSTVTDRIVFFSPGVNSLLTERLFGAPSPWTCPLAFAGAVGSTAVATMETCACTTGEVFT